MHEWGTTKDENAACHYGLDPESRPSVRRRPEQEADSGVGRYGLLF